MDKMTDDTTKPPTSENKLDALAGGVVVPFKPKVAPKQIDVPDIATAEAHFRMLGHNRGVYYFFSVHSGQVVAVRASQLERRSQLMMLAPLSWWELNFGSREEGLSRRGHDTAINWLIQTCNRSGVFHVNRLRGLGVWWDAGRGVFHAGNQLIVDGVPTRLNGFSSRFVYEAFQSLPVSEEVLSPEQGIDFIELCKALNWANPIYGGLLAGWTVCAMVCGALDWRPHIWLTGASSAGKSWVVAKIIRRALGSFVIAIQGNTSAAGLRQALGQNALPVAFDEAEGEQARTAEALQEVLALMRQASSEDGGDILKGGQDGTATAYTIRSMFLLASIVPQLKQSADENRVTVLTLNPNPPSDASKARFAKIEAKAAALFADSNRFPERLHALARQHLRVLRANIDVFRSELGCRTGSQRSADQLAPMLAGTFLLLHPGTLITQETAKEVICHLDLGDTADSAQASDEEKLLSRLMESLIEVIPEAGPALRLSVGEVVEIAANGSSTLSMDLKITQRSAMAALGRRGFKISDDRKTLLISNTSSGLAALLRDTPWSTGWYRVLKRIDGARSEEKTHRFGGAPSKAVSVPLRERLWKGS